MSLLTEQEIKDILIPLFIKQDQASIHWPDIFEEVALIESAVIEKIKAQGPVAWLHCERKDADVVTDAVKHVWGKVAVGSLALYDIPLYRLPEGD